MNVKEVCLTPEVLREHIESLMTNIFTLYFAYGAQVDLDESMISYMYACSKLREYQGLLRERTSLLIHLAERQATEGTHHSCDGCLIRIFSALHNVTEMGGSDTCRALDVPLVSNLAVKVLIKKKEVHEYMLKTLINILLARPESFDSLPQITEILPHLEMNYHLLEPLAQQYTLRFVYVRVES